MKAKSSAVKSGKTGTNWEFLRSSSDEGIDYSDIPRQDPAFWKDARPWVPRRKGSITLRLDQEILEWFRKLGKGYQTRMNAVLRSYVEHAALAKEAGTARSGGTSHAVGAPRSPSRSAAAKAR